MADYSYAEWERLGRPGGDFSAWQKQQPGYGTTQVSGPTDPNYKPSSTPGAPSAITSTSPVDFDQRYKAGEFAGNEAMATQLEVRRRRNMLYRDGMQDLPADVADIVLRDATGRVRKARSSQTMSALGAAFNSKDSLFGDY